MLKNYLVTAFRSFARNKAYSAINVAGLALGLACSFFILLWVRDELSFNSHFQDSRQVYRVMRHATFGGTRGTTSSMPKPLADLLDAEYPEFENTLLMSWGINSVLTRDEKSFRVDGHYFGPDLFQVFKFPVAVGDPGSALTDPESIVISASLARRFFGDDWRSRDDVLGAVFRVDNEQDVHLTAVMEDVPPNTSIRFEFVLPVALYIRESPWVEFWANNGLRMFARLQENADPVAVGAKIKDLIDEHVDAWESDVFLQPISDWYLRSDFEDGVQVGGRVEYVRIFILVAVFILLIAGINYMNLATARSAQRTREIGVRKSVGATRYLLARQFLAESVVTATLAYAFAMAIVVALLPGFNSLTGKTVTLSLSHPVPWLLFGALAIFTGLISGLYPAVYLASFSVVRVFRTAGGGRARGGRLRKALVVFQFAMSIVLIVGTLTVFRQLDYIRDKDLGLDRDNVVSIGFEGEVEDRYASFRDELRREPGVVSMAASSANPLNIGQDTISPRWDGKADDDNTLFSIISASTGFIETMQIELLDGRVFSEDYGADSTNFIINERAAEAMGMENPVGQPLSLWDSDGTIIGLVKDFHNESLYYPIEPVIIRFVPDDADLLFVRLAAGQTAAGLASLERVYSRFNPEYPFAYRFLDEEFDDMYRSETVIGTLANYFALFAVLIACLGLFALASFTAEQRTKEIGIRKVMGASIPSVVLLLSREFIALVVVAYAIAAPLAYAIMKDWLDGFVFHTEMGIGILAAAGVAAVLIAWLTVGYQSIRAASANPAVSLRTE